MRKWLALLFMVTAIGALGACGSVTKADDAGNSNVDARVNDAGVGIDASTVDATAPSSSREVTAGGTRVQGATYQVDVQIGHPIGQQPATGGGYGIEGAAAVKE